LQEGHAGRRFSSSQRVAFFPRSMKWAQWLSFHGMTVEHETHFTFPAWSAHFWRM